MKLIILIIVTCFHGNFARNINDETKPSVLIIGSSIPALTSALFLSDRNFSVTIVYSTNDIENQISPISTAVGDLTYRLPRHHPAIYEQSLQVRKLSERLGNTFTIENELYLHITNKGDMSISSNENLFELLFVAMKHECIGLFDIEKSYKIGKAIENMDYFTNMKAFSNISLAELARSWNAPKSFVSCFLNSVLINLGSNVEEINAADAINRMQFYYLSGKNGLRSYNMKNVYSSKNDSKLLVDQIYRQLKLKNTLFVQNYSIEAFSVDVDTGKILGDINKRSVQYDYIILGDTLNRSRNILTKTKQYNSGVPKVSNPLIKVLDSLNKYSNASNVLSIKLWLESDIDQSRPSIIQVNNSPYPSSIQSIRQIHKLSGEGNFGYILEIILAELNYFTEINWKKVSSELMTILPELMNNSILYYRFDPIDTGVLMDINYGSNRLSTSSLMEFGIPNLILAADWLDATNSTAADLERSVTIGLQAATLIQSRYKNRN